LYLTKIHAGFPEADAFFPKINFQEWRETNRDSFPADEKHPYSFTFLEYERLH
jgi:dihydrofolate reductase